jgi:hypothetical protein
MSAPWITVILALWLVVVILAVIQIGILRKILPVLDHTAAPPDMPFAPPTGALLPAFEASLADGSTITTAQMIGRPFILLFASQSCAPCQRLLLRLEGYNSSAEDAAVYLVMVDGVHADMSIPACVTPLLENGGNVSRALGVSTTPLAIAVDHRGAIAQSLVPVGPDDLDRLRRELEADHSRTGLKQPEHEPTAAIRHYTTGG